MICQMFLYQISIYHFILHHESVVLLHLIQCNNCVQVASFIQYFYITEQEVDGDSILMLQKSGTIELWL